MAVNIISMQILFYNYVCVTPSQRMQYCTVILAGPISNSLSEKYMRMKQSKFLN